MDQELADAAAYAPARRCCICAGQMLSLQSPGGSTFLCEMASWPHLIESVLLNRKSHSFTRSVFTLGTTRPNFIPIRSNLKWWSH